MMDLIISPKDSLSKIKLENVDGFSQEGQTLLVVFESGATRNYPLQHIWYYQSNVEYHRVIVNGVNHGTT